MGDAASASRRFGTLAPPNEFTISSLRHPACTGKMGVVQMTAALWVEVRIETKEDLDRFTPVGAVARGVEKPQIQLHMLAVIGREMIAARRFVQKMRYRPSHNATILVQIAFDNHWRGAEVSSSDGQWPKADQCLPCRRRIGFVVQQKHPFTLVGGEENDAGGFK